MPGPGFEPAAWDASAGFKKSRWLYAALHEFDFPFLYEHRPLWDITVILLSIGGIVLSGSTLWSMIKRLRRHTRRFARAIRSLIPIKHSQVAD